MSIESNKYLYLDHSQVESLKKKTEVWYVRDRRGGFLGRIAWHSAWRQYTFKPQPLTTFNPECLNDIAETVAELTISHSEAKC